MKRLDSMTLPELKKLGNRSRDLIILGVLFIILAAIFFFSPDEAMKKELGSMTEAEYLACRFLLCLLIAFPGVILVFFRTRGARIFLSLFSSCLLLIMLTALFAAIVKHDLGFLTTGSLFLLVPLPITVWAIFTIARSDCLFEPDAFSRKQIAEARKNIENEIPFTDEELSAKPQHTNPFLGSIFLAIAYSGGALFLAAYVLMAADLFSSGKSDIIAGNGGFDQKTFLLCWMAAENGDAEAQFALGRVYYWGTGVEKDEEEAYKWTSKAANQGLADAQADLGMYYINGIGVHQDIQEGLRLVQMAANQDNLTAQYDLALCYENGLGVEKDMAEAVKWLRKAADQGLPDAQAELGACYLSGLGVTEDKREGMKWIQQSVEQDNPMGKYLLSWCYKNGNGVEKDLEEYMRLLREAAEQGYPAAQTELGKHYLTGTEDLSKDLPAYARQALEENRKEGLKWIRMAAARGDSKAIQILEQQQ